MITRDRLREINRLVAEYEHPGTLREQRLRIRVVLRIEYGVSVDDLDRTSG